MKDGHCPKCDSDEVYQKRNGILSYGYLYAAIGLLQKADFTDYICTRCGYTESYVADQRQLPKIAQKWQRVRGAA